MHYHETLPYDPISTYVNYYFSVSIILFIFTKDVSFSLVILKKPSIFSGKIGDNTCSVDIDCAAAVNASRCEDGTCVCDDGFRVSDNNTVCVKRVIGDVCATRVDCEAAVMNSTCAASLTCQCDLGFAARENNTVCVVRKIYDSCTNDSDCAYAVQNSTCAGHPDDAWCACLYGFRENDNLTECVPRPKLPPYIEPYIPENPACDASALNGSSGCERYPDTQCLEMDGRAQCVCVGGFARLQPEQECVRGRGYTVTLVVAEYAALYDIWPLEFPPGLNDTNSSEFTDMSQRMRYSGLDLLMLTSPASDLYLGSRVLSMNPAPNGSGIVVESAIFLHFNFTSGEEDIFDMLLGCLNSTAKEIGNSRFYVSGLTNQSVSVTMLDECVVVSTPELHDCSPNATCWNTDTYYDCVCKRDFKERSEPHEFQGRFCEYFDRANHLLQLELARAHYKCSFEACNTPWSLVAGVLAVIFGLLLLLLVAEIYFRLKALREFNRRTPKLKRRNPYGAHPAPRAPHGKPKKVRISKQTTTVVYQRSNDTTPRTGPRPLPTRRANTPVPGLLKQGVLNRSFSSDSLDNDDNFLRPEESPWKPRGGVFAISKNVPHNVTGNDQTSLPGSVENMSDHLASSSDSLTSGSGSQRAEESSETEAEYKYSDAWSDGCDSYSGDAERKPPQSGSLPGGQVNEAYSSDSINSTGSVESGTNHTDDDATTDPEEHDTNSSGSLRNCTNATHVDVQPAGETETRDVEALIGRHDYEQGEDNLAIEMTNLDG